MPPIPLPEIHRNIILPPTPGSSKWSVSLRIIHQNPVCTSSLPMHATCIPHLIPLDLFTRIIVGEEYQSLNSSICSFLHSPVTLSLLGQNILFSTLFSKTLSLYSSPTVSAHVSHPYISTGEIIVLYI